jgi:hypothetical protein
MDSTSSHVYVNVGKEPVARVLAVTSHALVEVKRS